MVEFKTIVSSDTVRDLTMALEEQYDMWEGVLLDNFIFYGGGIGIEYQGYQAEYMIIREKYVNSRRSEYELILTNSHKTADKYSAVFQGDFEDW